MLTLIAACVPDWPLIWRKPAQPLAFGMELLSWKMLFLYCLARTVVSGLVSSHSDSCAPLLCYLRAMLVLWSSSHDLDYRTIGQLAFPKISRWSTTLMTSYSLDIIARSILSDLAIHKNPSVGNTFMKTKGHEQMKDIFHSLYNPLLRKRHNAWWTYLDFRNNI